MYANTIHLFRLTRFYMDLSCSYLSDLKNIQKSTKEQEQKPKQNNNKKQRKMKW